MDASEMRKRVFPSISFSSLVENESIIFESEKEREREFLDFRNELIGIGAIQPNRKSEGSLKRVRCALRSSLKNRGTDPRIASWHLTNGPGIAKTSGRERFVKSPKPLSIPVRHYRKYRARLFLGKRTFVFENIHSVIHTYDSLSLCPSLSLSLSFSFRFIILPLLFLLFPSFLSHYFSFLLSRCKIAIPGRGRDR